MDFILCVSDPVVKLAMYFIYVLLCAFVLALVHVLPFCPGPISSPAMSLFYTCCVLPLDYCVYIYIVVSISL